MFVLITVDKNSTTREEKAAGDSQEPFTSFLKFALQYSLPYNSLTYSYHIVKQISV